MIVEITSCAPVAAFSQPAIPPHSAPRPSRRGSATITCSRCGIPPNDEPAQTAAIEADDVLALPADVEQARPERVRDRQAREHQRRRQQQRLLEVLGRDRPVLGRDPREQPVQPRAVEDRLVGREGVRAREQDDDAADAKASSAVTTGTTTPPPRT
jgi:hypothetical protein